jgi:hypothetical protein
MNIIIFTIIKSINIKNIIFCVIYINIFTCAQPHVGPGRVRAQPHVGSGRNHVQL